MTLAAKPQKELINPLKPLAGLPLPNLLNRIILFGAGAGLLTWGIALTTSRVTLVTATKAFVNGKIITVTSPISGQVQTKASLDSGMPIAPKEVLLKVNEPLSKSELLQSLKFDLVAEQAKLESIEAKIKQIGQSGKITQPQRNQQLINQKLLETETNQAQEVALVRLDLQTAKTQADTAIRLAEQNIAQAQIELKTAQSHAQVAQSKYEKVRHLGNTGAISTFSVKEAYNNWQVSQNQVEAARVKLETAKIHQAQQQRLNVQQAQRQKLKISSLQSKPNELSITLNNTKTESLNPELTELERQKSQIQVSIEAKKKAFAQIEKDSLGSKNYPVLATSKGVLWEVMVQNGEQVNSGQPLLKQLNCQQLWVDAFVNIDALKRVSIGSPAQVELHNSNLKLNGWVKTIRSPLSREAKLGQDVAVNPPNVENQQLAQVRIELENPKELVNNYQSSAQFCQVGQVAKVNIDPADSLLANLPW
jgi:multidrug resistance efflux pump